MVLPHSYINISEFGASFPVGTVVYYQCFPGYKLEGAEILECMYNLIWSDSPPRCLDVEGKCLTVCSSFQFAPSACSLCFYLRAAPLWAMFPLAVQSLCGFCRVQPAVPGCTLSSWCSLSRVCSCSVPSARGKAPGGCSALETRALCCLSDQDAGEVT